MSSAMHSYADMANDQRRAADQRAANQALRSGLEKMLGEMKGQVFYARPRFCTDNGAMIAALGAAVVRRGLLPSSLDLPVDSSMPLETVRV